MRTLLVLVASALALFVCSAVEPGAEDASASPLTGIAAVSAGGDHTCALTQAGGVKCWGLNNIGELGDGTNVSSATPVDVSGLTSGVTAVTAGGSHTCALTAAGGVKCWGWNTFGQLGTGSSSGPEQCAIEGDPLPCSTTPVDVMGLTSGVVAISTGGSHTCAVTTGGGVKCWGYNAFGELGNGSPGPDTCEIADTEFGCSTAPVEASALTSGIAAATTGDHTCALTAGGGVKCWGHNGAGQLGIGTSSGPQACDFYDTAFDCSRTPQDVMGLASGVAAFGAGGGHTCAITTGGGLKCWGWNGGGELGDGTTCGEICDSPIDVPGMASGVAAVDAGGLSAYDGGGHTCALSTEGGVKCWGRNDSGQLGVGTNLGPGTCGLPGGPFACSTTPLGVPGLASGVAGVSAGERHACAVTTGGRVKCWGDNSLGQLGDGTTTSRNAPVDVEETPVYAVGDVNCDGYINSIDAVLILQFNAGLIFLAPCLQNADVNQDGPINSLDAVLVLQYDAGLLDTLPPS